MTAFIFVPLLAATAIVGGAVWFYASHVFVVITEETAAGNEVVNWDEEPMYDWLWQGLYIGWLVGVWLVPSLLLARLIALNVGPEWRVFLFVIIAFGVFWGSFPLSLLSSMAAESRFSLLHLGLFERLAKRTSDVLLFFLLSGLIVGACVPLVIWLVDGEGLISVVITGVLLALALILYARLMGRLACLARLTHIRPRKKKKGKKARPPRGTAIKDPWEVPEEVEREQSARGVGFTQPRELPPLESPYDGELTGYDVSFQDLPREPEPVSIPLPDEPLPVHEPEVDAGPARSQLARQDVTAIQPDRLEMERLSRRKEKLPKRPWTEGVWLFPLQPRTATVWGLVSVAFVLLGGMVRALIELWPF